MILIGIRGLLGCGKSTLAQSLAPYFWDCNAEIRPFAARLKNYLKSQGIDKQHPRYRDLAQFIGARFRKHNPDYWVQCWKDDIINGKNNCDLFNQYTQLHDLVFETITKLPTKRVIISDDVRYMNEANIFKDHGILIHVVRPGLKTDKPEFKHESEEMNLMFKDHSSFGITFTNDGTPEQLAKLVGTYIKNRYPDYTILDPQEREEAKRKINEEMGRKFGKGLVTGDRPAADFPADINYGRPNH